MQSKRETNKAVIVLLLEKENRSRQRLVSIKVITVRRR